MVLKSEFPISNWIPEFHGSKLVFSVPVIDDALCEQRLWDMKYKEVQNFYMCEIGKDFTIDATFKGNPSRFLNHSCDPNCVLEKWLVCFNVIGFELLWNLRSSLAHSIRLWFNCSWNIVLHIIEQLLCVCVSQRVLASFGTLGSCLVCDLLILCMFVKKLLVVNSHGQTNNHI